MQKKRYGFVLLAALMTTLISVQSLYADSKPVLESRILEAKKVMNEIMVTPDQSIPEELLAKCKAIVIYPSVLKAGFIFGGRFGKGVVLRRNEATGQWGPVAFSTIGGGSWGLQIGADATDLILVVMNDRGLEGLLQSNFTMGTDVGVAAGPVGRSTEAATDLTLTSGILSYSRSRGLFAGMAIQGAVLTEDNNSNSAYYGKSITSREILFGTGVNIPPSSKDLLENLNEYSSRWAKRLDEKKK